VLTALAVANQTIAVIGGLLIGRLGETGTTAEIIELFAKTRG
jgi:hypothetical protein